tara:strand:+ start:3831 stop:3971 length:141 start_codon:yes stop_codon:yes gene_type:complete
LILEIIFGTFFLIFMIFVCYIGAHVVHEQKVGRRLPFFWEKDDEED